MEPLTTLMRHDSDQSVRERAFWTIRDLGAEEQVRQPEAPAVALSAIQNMTNAQRLDLLREIANAVHDTVNAPGHLNTI